MPLLKDGETISPITKPNGEITTQDVSNHKNNPRVDYNWGVPSIAIPAGVSRVKWTAPQTTEVGSLITEKPQGKPAGNKLIPTDGIQRKVIVNVNYEKGPAMMGGYSQGSLISQQVANGQLPSTNQPGTPAKDEITTHGTQEIITPRPFGNYNGQDVISNVYIKGGKENAFTENAKGELTPRDLKYHGNQYRDLGGSYWKSLKDRGILS